MLNDATMATQCDARNGTARATRRLVNLPPMIILMHLKFSVVGIANTGGGWQCGRSSSRGEARVGTAINTLKPLKADPLKLAHFRSCVAG